MAFPAKKDRYTYADLLTWDEDYGKKDIAKVHALDGCFIELCKVFPE